MKEITLIKPITSEVNSLGIDLKLHIKKFDNKELDMNNKGISSPGIFKRDLSKRPTIMTKILEYGQFFLEEKNRELDKDTKDIRHSPIFKFTKRKSVEVLSPIRKNSPERINRRLKRSRKSTVAAGLKSGTIPQDPIENMNFSRKKARHFSYQNQKKPNYDDFLKEIERRKEKNKEKENEIIKEKVEEEKNFKTLNISLRDSSNDNYETDEDKIEEDSEDSISMIDAKEYIRDYYSDTDALKISKYLDCEIEM